jgi:hypothetical protein
VPPLHDRLPLAPDELVSRVEPEDAKEDAAEVGGVVQVLPASHEAAGVDGDQTLEAVSGRKVDHGQEDDLQLGGGHRGCKDANECANGTACAKGKTGPAGENLKDDTWA